MKISAFDDLYDHRVVTGSTLLTGSGGSNSAFGGDVVGEIGDLAVVGLRREVSLASNLLPVTVGDTLTIISASPAVARFATPSNASSYGSNATRVSEVSSGGAATTISRSDHIHDGIGTVTASSSNTMQRGTFNLRAGTGIALALADSDGDGEFDTATIVNTSGGGGAPGGSGVTWTQDINESGASFTNWTAATGTWASDGTTINQTDTTATYRRAKYNTKIALGFGFIFEFEFRFPTAGQGGGGNIQAIMLMGFDGSGAGSVAIVCDKATSLLEIAHDATTSVRSISQAFSLDTYYKIRAVLASGYLTFYLDGTLLGSIGVQKIGSSEEVADYLGIGTFGSTVNFRNIKAWTLSGSAPA